MKITVLYLLVLLTSASLFAQENIEVLKLKNGSTIKGKIIEKDTENIKINLAGNIIIVRQDEVISIDAETPVASNKNIMQKGYFNLTTFGVLIGSTVNVKVAPISCLIEHNYKITNYFAIGGVFGFETLNEIVCPLALTLKACLPVKSGNFFLGTTGGYSFSTEKPIEYGIKKGSGGNLFNAEIGYLMAISENTGIYFAIGYRYNELNYKMEDWWWNGSDRKMYFERISFRTGISLF